MCGEPLAATLDPTLGLVGVVVDLVPVLDTDGTIATASLFAHDDCGTGNRSSFDPRDAGSDLPAAGVPDTGTPAADARHPTSRAW